MAIEPNELPDNEAAERDYERQLREMNEQLLISVVRQHELTEKAENAERATRQSEEQFRRSIEHAPIPVIMHAEDGEVLQVSRSWTDLTGYSLADNHVIQKWLTKAYGVGGEDVREAMRRAFLPSNNGKPLRAVVFDIATRAGEHRTWSFNASAPGVLADGRRFVVGMAEDITERRKTEEALRRSEERYRLFVNAVSDILYKMSADWSEMLSLEGKGFLDDTENPSLSWLEKYIPDTDRSLVQPAIAEALRTKSPFELEHRVVRADGSIGWAFSRAVPLLDASGEIVEWFGAASDITARKQSEEDLRRNHETLRQHADDLDRFNRVAVGRETRMIELKKEVNELSQRLGVAAPYPLEFEQEG